MDIVWKGVLGGLITALIAVLSKRGNVLPGILPLAPTFSIIALTMVGNKGSASGFRETCIAGAKTIPAYLTFILICYLLSPHVDYRLAIAGGIAGWLLVAALVFFGPRLFA